MFDTSSETKNRLVMPRSYVVDQRYHNYDYCMRAANRALPSSATVSVSGRSTLFWLDGQKNVQRIMVHIRNKLLPRQQHTRPATGIRRSQDIARAQCQHIPERYFRCYTPGGGRSRYMLWEKDSKR